MSKQKNERTLELYRLRLRAGEVCTVEACRELIADLIDFLMESENV
jgi:hypothetical protein